MSASNAGLCVKTVSYDTGELLLSMSPGSKWRLAELSD